VAGESNRRPELLKIVWVAGRGIMSKDAHATSKNRQENVVQGGVFKELRRDKRSGQTRVCCANHRVSPCFSRGAGLGGTFVDRNFRGSEA